ncbi:Hypothetical predicted protein [Pelobates cultripes]|uniref:Uncharacterized protein n=1 Tax=Pelobates cultripes TaxID=61616 RepID=A0AAD1RDG0_PELCU|nr:Hypothetical predicted protein [Pelobates cultripes]
MWSRGVDAQGRRTEWEGNHPPHPRRGSSYTTSRSVGQVGGRSRGSRSADRAGGQDPTCGTAGVLLRGPGGRQWKAVRGLLSGSRRTDEK